MNSYQPYKHSFIVRESIACSYLLYNGLLVKARQAGWAVGKEVAKPVWPMYASPRQPVASRHVVLRAVNFRSTFR